MRKIGSKVVIDIGKPFGKFMLKHPTICKISIVLAKIYWKFKKYCQSL